MLLLLVIPIWALLLVMVAGLCAAARIGDRERASDAAGNRREPGAPIAHPAIRAGSPPRVRAAAADRELAA